MGMATATTWAAGAGAIITDGAGAADTIIAADQPIIADVCVRRSIAPTKANIGGMDGRAGRRDRSGLCQIRLWSAQPHLDRDPYQVGMVLGAELLLQQRGGVGDGFVGNIEGIG